MNKKLEIVVDLNKLKIKSKAVIKLPSGKLLTEKKIKRNNFVFVINNSGIDTYSSCYIEGFNLDNCAVAGTIARNGDIIAVGGDLKKLKAAVKGIHVNGGVSFAGDEGFWSFPLLVTDEVVSGPMSNMINHLMETHGCELKYPLFELSTLILNIK